MVTKRKKEKEDATICIPIYMWIELHKNNTKKEKLQLEICSWLRISYILA
jgi:hypothetical protein